MTTETYIIIGYPEVGSDDGKYIWKAESKRQVVGLLKTIMDNFDPVHVDIMKESAYKHKKYSRVKK